MRDHVITALRAGAKIRTVVRQLVQDLADHFLEGVVHEGREEYHGTATTLAVPKGTASAGWSALQTTRTPAEAHRNAARTRAVRPLTPDA